MTLTLTTVFGFACAPAHQHGQMSTLSQASSRDWQACEHDVPAEVCVRCKPELVPSFKQRGDWCGEHDVPESQCLACHPELDFSPPEPAPPEADLQRIVQEGEDLVALEPHLAPGKFTVFDFRADWCPPCHKVRDYLVRKMKTRGDLAVRELNVVSWESPIAERWLRDVPELPLLIVYDASGKRIATLHGAKLKSLDELLGEP